MDDVNVADLIKEDSAARSWHGPAERREQNRRPGAFSPISKSWKEGFSETKEEGNKGTEHTASLYSTAKKLQPPAAAEAEPTRAAQQTELAPWEKAQKRLNHFVRFVALVERTGNGLGTMAFTWATVVVLGGFSTDLGQDFWYATAIVFLEAFRVFSRENRSDDQLLFRTTGGIKLKRVALGSGSLYYLNAVIVMVCSSKAILFVIDHYIDFGANTYLMLAALLALVSRFELSTYIETLSKGNTVILRFSPIVALALLASGSIFILGAQPLKTLLPMTPLFAAWLAYNILAPLNSSLKETQSQSTKKELVDVVVKLSYVIFPLWIAISLVTAFGTLGFLILVATAVLGNIQIPVAVARIALSSMRLFSEGSHHNTSNENLVPALKIFYIMVLGQGILYTMACMLETTLSFLFRRSLALFCEILNKQDIRCIDLYYEYAFDKCMEDGVLSQDDLSLFRFAIDSLDSNSSTRKHAAVQILHTLLLQTKSSKTLQVSEITTSTKVVNNLINMLGLTTLEGEDKNIRLFASKIIVELAGDLRIVGMTGTMQMISSLLDAENPLVNQDHPAQTMANDEQNFDNHLQCHDSNTTLDIEPQAAGNDKCDNNICRFIQHIKTLLFIPGERKKYWKDEDSFPSLGMQILEKLAHDLDNCAEISKATGLIPRIVGFISYTNTSDARENLIITSSLKLTAKLASTTGEIGPILRQKILEQPFLLSNLVDILEDTSNHMEQNTSREQWKLMMVIIANLAIDEKIRKNIGSFQMIIPKLMHTFLGPHGSSSKYDDHSLKMVAGEALSKLSMEKDSYCTAMVEESGYDLIENLQKMLEEDDYTNVAASLMWSLCVHSKDKLGHQHLLSALRVALTKMINAEGKKLEVFVGLAAQICNCIHKDMINKQMSNANGADVAQKMVCTLISNKQSLEYPRMRRVIVEMAISIIESCPDYANIFKEQGMMKALSKMERTLKLYKVDKCNILYENDAVISESSEPQSDMVVFKGGVISEGRESLSDLVARAKMLIDPAVTTRVARSEDIV